jgi:hypothetical protein
MPLLILGAIVIGLGAAYLYALKNKEKYVREDDPPKSPFDVVYLPADYKEVDES